MSHRAFISYATESQTAAETAYALLNESGVSCWMASQDIPPTESWIKAIMEAIKSCDVLILFLCAHANDSKHVLTEVERAFHYDKKILTVVLENITPRVDFEYLLSLHQWLDASTSSVEAVLPRMLEVFQALVEEVGPSSEAASQADSEDPLDAMPLKDLVAEGLALVAEEIQPLADSDELLTPREVGRVMDIAIHYGAPAYNRGSVLGCAEIYWSTSRLLRSPLEESLADCEEAWLGPFQRLARQLAQIHAAYPRVEKSEANEIAWALRHAFDRFHAARGIQEVETLIKKLKASGLPGVREVVLLPLALAIQHGNHIFDANDIEGCAELHHFTAKQLNQFLSEAPKPSAENFDPEVPAFHQQLQGLLNTYPAVENQSHQDVAWAFYQLYIRILKAPDNPTF